MSNKLSNFNNNSDASINKKIANIMIQQYQKGLNIKNQEITETDDATPTSIVIGNTDINTKNVKQPSKSYSVRNHTISKKTDSSDYTSFITKSQLLDNEVNQFVTLMRLNNKKEFYGGSIKIKGGSDNVESKIENKEIDLETKIIINELLNDIFTKISVSENEEKQITQEVTEEVIQITSDVDDNKITKDTANIKLTEIVDTAITQGESAVEQKTSDADKLTSKEFTDEYPGMFWSNDYSFNNIIKYIPASTKKHMRNETRDLKTQSDETKEKITKTSELQLKQKSIQNIDDFVKKSSDNELYEYMLNTTNVLLPIIMLTSGVLNIDQTLIDEISHNLIVSKQELMNRKGIINITDKIEKPVSEIKIQKIALEKQRIEKLNDDTIKKNAMKMNKIYEQHERDDGIKADDKAQINREISNSQKDTDSIVIYSKLLTPTNKKNIGKKNYKEIRNMLLEYQEIYKMMNDKRLGSVVEHSGIQKNIKDLETMEKNAFVNELTREDLYNIIKSVGRLDTTTNKYKSEIISRVKSEKDDKLNDSDAKRYQTLLQSLGYNFIKERTNKSKLTNAYNNITMKTIKQIYLGTSNDDKFKSKNGITITSSISPDNLETDKLTSIKKITNIVQELLPLAQTLANNNFSSINESDKVTVLSLYKDLDDKMYIITSLNLQTNTSLIKLDKLFDNLFDTIHQGLSRYAQKTISGGSIVLKHKIDQLYYL